MGWMSLRFVIPLYLTAYIIFFGASGTKNTLKIGLSRVPPLHKWRLKTPSILGEPTAICHCSYQNYMQLKSRDLFQRADVFSLKRSHATNRMLQRDLIYAPMCCKIDLSDPNKLYRYPVAVQLTEKTFNEYLNDPNSSQFKALASELTNAKSLNSGSEAHALPKHTTTLQSVAKNEVNQLFPGDSSLVSVEVSAFRSGSVIADLILTTKGIFPQAMYDGLKMAIESGQLGQLTVALAPIMVPTQSPSSTAVPILEPPTVPSIPVVPTKPSVTAPPVGVIPGPSEGQPTELSVTAPPVGVTSGPYETQPTQPSVTALPVGVTPGPSEVQPTQPSVTAPPVGVTPGPSEVQPTQPTATAPPVGVTSGPSEVQPTQPSVTALPVGVTHGPSEVQPTQPSVTAPPVGVTPAPSEIQPTQPSVTAPPISVTPAPSEVQPTQPSVTEPPVDVTAGPSKVQPTQPTVTAPPVGVTSGPSEVQPTQPSVTALPVGVTPGPSEVQPTQPSVTAPPVGVTPGPSEVQPTQPSFTAPPVGVTPGPSEVQPTQPSVTAPPIGVTSGPSEVQPTQPSVTAPPDSVTPGPSEVRVTQPPSAGGNTGSTTKAEFEKECLCSHNQKREAHGTPLMTWSADISASATVWAKSLAAKDTFEHDKSNSLYGENLYMEWGKSSAKGLCHIAVDKWYDEIKDYDFNTPGFKSGTGHFTQVVWKKSIKLGVGEGTSSSGKRYIVARYEERGNVMGYFAENVPPPVSGTPAGPSADCSTGGGEKPTGGEGQPPLTESPSLPSGTDQTPAGPKQGSIITPTNAPTGPVPISALIPGQSTPKPSEAVVPGVTPNPLVPGQSTPKPSEAVFPAVTQNPLVPGQSTPKPSEAVIPSVTSNPLVPRLSTPKPSESVIPVVTPNPAVPEQSTPKPGEALIPTTGAVTPNPLMTAPPAEEQGGATPFPVPGIVTPSPITTGPTLPTGAGLPSATLPGVTPPPGTEGGMPTLPSEKSPSAGVGPKPNEPLDARPSTPYDPVIPAQLIKVVIKLLEKIFSPDLANTGTAAYQKLKVEIENSIRAAFETTDTLRSVTATNFKASEGKHLRNIIIGNSIRRAPAGVDAEVELSFRENQPDQLKPLEQKLATGKLGVHRVLQLMSAIIIGADGASGATSCPELCMGTTICQPQCPTQCCPSTKPTICPSSCSNACAPGCTLTCCSFGPKVQDPQF